jgi:hypothetical protein
MWNVREYNVYETREEAVIVEQALVHSFIEKGLRPLNVVHNRFHRNYLTKAKQLLLN